MKYLASWNNMWLIWGLERVRIEENPGFICWGLGQSSLYGLDGPRLRVPHLKNLLLKQRRNKFHTKKDAFNKCENEWIFLNFLEFSGIYLNLRFLRNAWWTNGWANGWTKPLIESERSCVCISTSIVEVSLGFLAIIAFFVNGLRTDGRTDGPTDQRTDKASYRDAGTHLKTK